MQVDLRRILAEPGRCRRLVDRILASGEQFHGNFAKLTHAPDRRFVVIGEGTHAAIMETE
ncbi:hypothetical protein Mnod_3283 [Methylobacterium nodulans ORS 2060]|uniref:Uncharacterized protein n=1 Tax=Methylobacterium nodulans (strain LMG 21967 / CNCM I-2342 / ORS 2060) TaxID=460265 RepID=B8IL18_METNO|nr:hypothetical protein Mnod_3283 [Methylobacterium nodulans ORS 2060]